MANPNPIRAGLETRFQKGNPWAWKPGQSGNVRGINTSPLRKLIGERTLEGEQLVDFVYGILRGVIEEIGEAQDGSLEQRATLIWVGDKYEGAKLRMEAATWLADRYWGRPAAAPAEPPPPPAGGMDYSKLTEAELETFLKLAVKARTQATEEPDDATP